MWIRSQNREILLDMDGLCIHVDKYNKRIRAYNTHDFGGSSAMIGVYSTVEKCIKVLDIIEDARFTVRYSKSSRDIIHMPQDDEVEE